MTKHSSIAPDLQRKIDAAFATERQNPDKEAFIQTYVEGVGWRFISAKTGKEYTPDTFKEEFGYYPNLPHPEVFYSDEAMTERQKRKRSKPKGFAITVPIKSPQ